MCGFKVKFGLSRVQGQPNLLYGPKFSLLLPPGPITLSARRPGPPAPRAATRCFPPPSPPLAGRRLPHRPPQRAIFCPPDPPLQTRWGEEAAPRKMGWKAAEKLIRHWKILRGDNVISLVLYPPLRPPVPLVSPTFFSLLDPPFPLVFHCQVMIIRGKDKGETGLIKRVIRSQNRVIVEGKNLVMCRVACFSSFI